MTATGSVGLISAPKTRHQASGMAGPPSASSTPFSPKPTSTVENRVPKVASARIARRPPRMSRRSMPKAPANSRNESIPSSSVVRKSSPWTKAFAHSWIGMPGTSRDTNMTSAEKSAPMIVRPIVCGIRRKRAFRVAKTAVSTTTMAAASNGERALMLRGMSDPVARLMGGTARQRNVPHKAEPARPQKLRLVVDELSVFVRS